MELGLRSLPTASVLGNVTLCSHHLGMLPQRATAEKSIEHTQHNTDDRNPVAWVTHCHICHPQSNMVCSITVDHTLSHWCHLVTQHCISSLLHSGPKYHTRDRITTRRVSKMV